MGKKILSTLIKVAAVLAAFYVLTLLFMPKYIEENTDGRITSEFYREKTPIDVIFIGSSIVQAGISPMSIYKETGLTAYDRSNSSQVMPIGYAMVCDAIMRNKPKLVVCDVGFLYNEWGYVDEGASRKSLDGLKWSEGKSECIKASMDETESFIDYVFPILRFHSRWNDLNAEDFKYLLYKPTVTYNGQLLQFGTDGKTAVYNPFMEPEGKMICDENIAWLQKTVDLCKSEGVDVMLLKMPMIEGNWSETYDNQIAEFAKENGILYKSYVNEFDSFGFDRNTDFTDGQHMNSVGAEKFTKVLSEYIIENYDVGKSSDEAKVKAVFDKKLQKYEAAMAEGRKEIFRY